VKLDRRSLLHLGIGAIAAAGGARSSFADTFPSRPVKIVVPFAPGGIGDILMRLIGTQLQERLGQPFIVENRPGAGGNLGAELVAKSPGDGYTLLSTGTPNTINASYYDKLNFDFIRDLMPVAGVTHGPLFMVINPSVPAQNVPEFIAYAKANPGKIAMASSGNGTAPHLSGELFKMMAGVDMVHVPYRSEGPAIADVVSGQVQLMFPNPPAAIEHIRAGKLRALAVTSAEPVAALPGVPALASFVPGYEATAWLGLGAPRSTPPDIIDKLNKEINAVLATPEMRERIAGLGSTAFVATPNELAAFIVATTGKWAKVVAFAGIKAP
jgi:tripartite-type tricarboxylate transporter receptor subunit TctC